MLFLSHTGHQVVDHNYCGLLMYLLCYIIYEVGNVNIDVQKVD